ncbi:hypothetical protein SDC9_179284 [bioreactor metagenome]|uniref:Uncharacterized protein n=1 Tax=bioreactor metagenome TaxID=1076179 RepID=A0A645H1D9_9ZZZZ
MEVVFTNNDFLFMVLHALHIRAPAACGFERGFHRLGAGVHRQRHGFAGQRAHGLVKLTEQRVVKRA